MADNRVYGNASTPACTPGGEGPLNAKQRLMTTQLDSIETLLGNAVITRGFISDASSGGLTSGSVYTALASGTTRTFVEIQNTGAYPVWFNFGADAVAAQPSMLLAVASAPWRSPVNFCPQDKLTILTGNGANPGSVAIKYGSG
jgi:hypothetical protein